MAGLFKKATRDLARFRAGLCAPAGAGKTWSALELAFGILRLLKPDGRVAVIDSERGSAAKYQGLIGSAGLPFDFDICTLGPDYNPRRYIEAMRDAAKEGFFVVVIDGISQAWAGTGGLLEFKDQQQAKQKGGNGWTAWREVTPEHNRFVDAMLASPFHLVATMRAKTEWVQDTVEKDGRKITVPRKIGLAPVQRDGLEYEFDVMFDLDQDSHKALVTKTRYPQAFPDTFNERIHFDAVEKLAPLLTNDPITAARAAEAEESERAERERAAREREAQERARKAAERQQQHVPANGAGQAPAGGQEPAKLACGCVGKCKGHGPDPEAQGTQQPSPQPEAKPDANPNPPPPPAGQQAPAGEPAKDESPADAIARRIRSATDATQLLRIMPDVRKHPDADEKDLLTHMYQERKKELIAQAAGKGA